MRVLADRVALLTGACGGIGRVVAHRLAEAGCHLALTDVDADGLQALAASLPSGRRITTHVVDVRDPERLDALALEVREAHGELSILIASAGVTVFGPFEKHTRDDVDWLLDINLRGMVHTVRALLPLLRETAGRHGEGHVICMSSMQAMFGVPTQSLYSASKYAVRGFAAALRAELGARSLGVTAVLPGAVRDGFMRNGRSHDDAMVDTLADAIGRFGCTPEQVAAGVMRGIRRNKAEVVVGLDAHVVGWTRWLVPSFLPALVGWSYRRFTPEGSFGHDAETR